MLLIYHLVSIKIYGSDYDSTSPNHTVFIHPLFSLCLANKCKMCSCFYYQPLQVKLALSKMLEPQRICRLISEKGQVTFSFSGVIPEVNFLFHVVVALW